MEIYIILGLVFLIAVLVLLINAQFSKKRKIFKNNLYSYTAKQSVMTRAEGDFFMTLDRAVKQYYYVFPQVHLSSLLDHHIVGQDWRYAFSHVNGKSVDFVLCDRQTLQPIYAIELDDYTHDKKDRQVRDREVERIFKDIHMPLVRFSNKDVSEKEIIETLEEAYKHNN
jgi:hypothetical protein